MAASHEASYVMAYLERRKNLACCRELALRSYKHRWIVFSGIFACNVVQPCCANSYCLFARSPAVNALNNKPVIVPYQCCKLVKLFRRIQLDNPVAFSVCYVHYCEFESLAQLLAYQKPCAVHWVSKSKIKRKVKCSSIALVCCENNERLVGPFLNLHLGN